MIGPRHLLALSALLLAFHSAAALAQAWTIEELGPGVAMYSGDVSISGDLVEVRFVRTEPESVPVKLFTPRTAFEQRGIQQTDSAIPDGLPIRDFADITDALAVLAGGYVASFKPVVPLGYVQSGSEAASPRHDSWLVDAMLCANGTEVELGLVRALYDKRTSYADCLQIGPMLILEGKPYFGARPAALPAGAAKLLVARQRQGFVCRDEAGAFMIGVAAETTLEHIIPVLLRPLAQGGLGCRIASRVTGSTTATLATRDDTFGPDTFLLPTVVAILPSP